MTCEKEAQLFRIAVTLESAELRQAYLRQSCEGNPSLRLRLERLLAADSRQRNDLLSLADSEETPEPTGNADCFPRVMGYRILERLGEGGSATVYKAEKKGSLRQPVALKILKTSLADEKAAFRFSIEQSTLATLNHPYVAAAHAAGESEEGFPYVVIEYVDGLPITVYCDDRELSLRDRLNLFCLVCEGVQHAHYKGIIHRDLKPSNILIQEIDHRPQPKIIDFGIAKTVVPQSLSSRHATRDCELLGTLEYMSPEQLSGQQQTVDTRSDIYALGVVLHELLTGRVPFAEQLAACPSLEHMLSMIRTQLPPKASDSLPTGPSAATTAASRSTTLSELTRTLRKDVDCIVAHALEKHRDDRYSSANSLRDDITRYLQHQPILARPPHFLRRLILAAERNESRIRRSAFITGFLAIFTVALLLWQSHHRANLLEEQQQQQVYVRTEVLPSIAALSRDGKNLSAFLQAREVQPFLANDAAFQRLWQQLHITASSEAVETGTAVSVRNTWDPEGHWHLLARAPFQDIPLPSGPLRVRLDRPGFVSRELQLHLPTAFSSPAACRLIAQPDDRAGSVWIPGNTTAGSGLTPPINAAFWLDRTEVSNADYLEFVQAGGYENPTFWQTTLFVRDDAPLTFAEAMSLFVDQTGRPGPSTWRNGTFPNHAGAFPVSGVSWFEAAAYASYRAASLPTVHHWEWAASTDQPGIVAAQGNHMSGQPAPCGTTDAVGRFDARELAGNVREWCWNADEAGQRYSMGGDYLSPAYAFTSRLALSPWDRSPQNGFRCMQPAEGAGDNALLNTVPNGRQIIFEQPRIPFEQLERWYTYDRHTPLDPMVVREATALAERPQLQHEIVEITTAYGDGRFQLHLLFPQGLQGPAETIVFAPGINAWNSGGPFRFQNSPYYFPLAEHGRIICFPVYEGTFDRWPGKTLQQQFREHPIAARDDYLRVSKDISRAVDYLLTRPDVSAEKLIYFGLSNGAQRGPMLLSTDSRLQAGILFAGGYSGWHMSHPEIHLYQFTPHVTQPILMINGADDHVYPVNSSQKPMFLDLGSDQKDHVLLAGGHLPPAEEVCEVIEQWLTDRFASESPTR